jgi:GAF domain-containing protein
MAVPMIAGDRLVGILDVQDDDPDRFSAEDVNILTTLAAQVAVSLQNARSFVQAQRQAEREALINTISERIQSTSSVEAALQVAVREIGRALGARHTAVRLGVDQRPGDGSA